MDPLPRHWYVDMSGWNWEKGVMSKDKETKLVIRIPWIIIPEGGVALYPIPHIPFPILDETQKSSYLFEYDYTQKNTPNWSVKLAKSIIFL